jgi:hypothetical protein
MGKGKRGIFSPLIDDPVMAERRWQKINCLLGLFS